MDAKLSSKMPQKITPRRPFVRTDIPLFTRRSNRVLILRAFLGVAVTLCSHLTLNRAYAELDNCPDPLPKPGATRPWEVGIDVSPYCEVNTRNRNLFSAIPIIGWSGTGPDMSMALYHNSATVGYPTNWTSHTGINLGPGWTIAYGGRLVLNLPNTVTAVDDD